MAGWKILCRESLSGRIYGAVRLERDDKCRNKRFELVGTLRNTQREYVIVFEATEQGERIEPAKLLPIMSEKQNVRTLLQVITYWINENEYRIDFSLWQDNNKENV